VQPKAQWGIYLPHGWYEREEDQTARHAVALAAPENVAASKVLLFGPRGEELVVQRPRPIGFRKP